MRASGVDMTSMNNTLKYLEKEVNKIYDKTSEGMIAAMLDTIRRAMKLCPVVYGNLRASSYVTWGSKRTPKGAAKFVDNPFNDLRVSEMAEQHQRVLAENKQIAGELGKGLKPRMGSIGFSAIYALKIHENPRSGNTGGTSPSGKPYPNGSYSRVGQWKFLETPLKETNRIMGIIRRKSGTK